MSTSGEDFPLVVRGPTPDEIPMVLANWKQELLQERLRRGWGKGLREQDYWRLVNHVIDRITLPQSSVYIGAHPDNAGTPLMWMAVRDGVMLYSYARRSITSDRPLAEKMESAMLAQLPVVAIRIHDFDPFRELERSP